MHKFYTLLCCFISLIQFESFSQCNNPPTIGNVSVLDVSCFNSSDGSITVTVTNGQIPYTYLWSDPSGQTTATINNIPAGNYTVTITDAIGCTTTGQFSINQPSELQSSVSASDATCSGSDDGTAVIFVTGGTPPYWYDWANGISGGPQVNNLSAGFYNVTVTDANGCTQTNSFIVNEPAAINLEIISITGARCGLCDGSANLQASGGVGNYTYNTSNGDTTPTPSGLCSGTYSTTVTDNNGCTATTIFNVGAISNADTLLVDLESTDILCNGSCDGRIQAIGSCGTGAYTYVWSTTPPQATASITGLCPGVYTVTITDEGGLTATATTAVNEPNPIDVVSNITNSTCRFNNDGCVDITVTGGTSPFVYIWSNGVNTEDICGLPNGNYSLTVVDANDCSFTSNYIIENISDFDIPEISSTPSCNNDGSATVTPDGGIPPYTYNWNNGDTTATITGLASAWYVVTLSDASGCSIVSEVFVDPSVQFEVETTTSDCNDQNGTAAVVNLMGSQNPTFAWSNGGAGPSQNNLITGGYSVTVTDAITGCRNHENLEILQDSSCFVTIFGYIYDDGVQPDCQIDPDSKPLKNARVELSNGQVIFTNSAGFYRFLVPPGMYTITSVLNTQTYEALCADPIIIDANTAGTTYPDNNFFYKNKGNFDLSLKVSKGRPRPGFERQVTICVMNFGSTPVSGTLTFNHDPLQEYRGANFPETSYDSNTSTVTWDFSDLQPGPIRIYRVKMYTPTTVPNGTVLLMTFHVDPVTGDLNPNNNTIVDCPVVTTNSYDPNDKAVLPVGEGAIGRIDQTTDNQLEYRVRFQNTGTDTAYTVVIRDQLDESLDPSTIIPGASSHDYVLQILDGNILEFRFDNIYLPDSNVNQVTSNGFVFFDVQLKKNLLPGTEITNEADIFFDFNPPVRTNTVLNTIRGEDVITQQTIQSCDSLFYNGQYFTTDATVTDTIPLLLYDSIVITDVRIVETTETRLTITYCDGDNPVDPGIYTEVFRAANGCDSIIITEVFVQALSRVNIDTMLASDGTYAGQVYTSDTILVNTYLDQNGCDSIVTVNISVMTTQTKNLWQDANVQVFPNPTQGDVSIVFNDPLAEAAEVQLFNLLGQKMIQQKIIDQSHQLSLISMPAGTYWIMIHQGEASYTGKIVLIK